MPPGLLICVVCGKHGKPGDTANGWRLAPNRPGGYTCGKICDDVVVAYDEEQKELKKKRKKKS